MTIAFFPDLVEGELLNNPLATYSEIMRYPTHRYISRDFYKLETGGMRAALPSNIDTILRSLPEGHLYSADEIIDKNTLFSYYSSYMTKEEANNFRQYLRDSNKGKFEKPILYSVRFLRYCPKCAREDKELHGRCFWRREHQIPYVDICCHHHDVLWQTQIKSVNLVKYISLERALTLGNAEPITIPDIISKDLEIRIATDSYWLLTKSTPNHMLHEMREKYKVLLFNLGIISNSEIVKRQSINSKSLVADLSKIYSKETLAYFGIRDASRNEYWVTTLVHNHQPSDIIRHILFTYFLGYSVIDLWTNDFEYNSPIYLYPCLNHLCSHFRKLFIKNPIIREDKGFRDKRIQAITISCPECGFIYARTRTFSSNDDLYKMGRVVKHGWLWEETFRKAWQDPEISIGDLLIKLNISMTSVYKQAIKLNLSPYRPNGSVLQQFVKLWGDEDYEKKALSDSSHDISDAQWELIEPIISEAYKYFKKVNPYRKQLNAILWKYHLGLNWSFLPERYGKWRHASDSYNFWRVSGVLDKIFTILGLQPVKHF